MLLIILTQIVIAITLATIYFYRELLFTNLFYLVFTGVLFAFIPNFVTSILLCNNYISDVNSQISFGITGTIALTFLYIALRKYDVK